MARAVAEARAERNITSVTGKAIVAKASAILAHAVGAAGRCAGAGQGAAVAIEACVVALAIELSTGVLLTLALAMAVFGASSGLAAIVARKAVRANALACVEVAPAIAGAVVRAYVPLASLT